MPLNEPYNDYPSCTTYPCRNPSCPNPDCRAYQFRREHIHPLHRRPSRRPSYNDYPDFHYHRHGANPTYLHGEAFKFAAQVEAERKNAEDKVKREAAQKVQDAERGKAERDKDVERGRWAREVGAKKMIRGEVESESDWDREDRKARQMLRFMAREKERERERDREREKRRDKADLYWEKRVDARGGKYVLVRRERVSSWGSCFSDW